jgi:hypothetical protein
MLRCSREAVLLIAQDAVTGSAHDEKVSLLIWSTLLNSHLHEK